MAFLKDIEEWGRTRALGALAKALKTQDVDARKAGESLAQNPSAKILLVGIYQHMGQFLCATPLIRALRTAWPQATIHFLGNPVNTTAARANPHLDRVWVWRKNAPAQWPGELRELRNERYDLALLLTTDRPSATGVILSRMTGAQWVAAYAPAVSGEWARDTSSLCHIRIPHGEEKNEVEKFLGLARAFGIPPQGRHPEFVISPKDAAAADAFFSNHPLAENGPWVGLFIGGKGERSDRLWPVAHFAQLADSLMKAGFRVVALSPPPASASSDTFLSDEHLRLQEFRQALERNCPVFQEASLGRVAAFIQRLQVLVCPDGGILHLAAAVGTSTLGLFFSTDPDVWRHDQRQAILDGRGKPAAEMRPETVAQEVIRFLSEPARP